MSFTSPTPQWGLIIDRDNDFKPYIQYPLGKFDQDTVLDLIVGAASDWVSSYLDRPIAPTTFHERFDGWSGWGGATIMLPYTPVLQIVSVSEYRGTNGSLSLVEQTPTAQWGVGHTAGAPGPGTYQINPRTGSLMRTFPGLIQKPFFPGSRNVEVTWVAGYDPIPRQVKIATLQLANYWYRNTQEQAEIAPPFQGDTGGAGGHDLWPAVPNHVTMMLEPFTQIGIG